MALFQARQATDYVGGAAAAAKDLGSMGAPTMTWALAKRKRDEKREDIRIQREKEDRQFIQKSMMTAASAFGKSKMRAEDKAERQVDRDFRTKTYEESKDYKEMLWKEGEAGRISDLKNSLNEDNKSEMRQKFKALEALNKRRMGLWETGGAGSDKSITGEDGEFKTISMEQYLITNPMQNKRFSYEQAANKLRGVPDSVNKPSNDGLNYDSSEGDKLYKGQLEQQGVTTGQVAEQTGAESKVLTEQAAVESKAYEGMKEEPLKEAPSGEDAVIAHENAAIAKRKAAEAAAVAAEAAAAEKKAQQNKLAVINEKLDKIHPATRVGQSQKLTPSERKKLEVEKEELELGLMEFEETSSEDLSKREYQGSGPETFETAGGDIASARRRAARTEEDSVLAAGTDKPDWLQTAPEKAGEEGVERARVALEKLKASPYGQARAAAELSGEVVAGTTSAQEQPSAVPTGKYAGVPKAVKASAQISQTVSKLLNKISGGKYKPTDKNIESLSSIDREDLLTSLPPDKVSEFNLRVNKIMAKGDETGRWGAGEKGIKARERFYQGQLKQYLKKNKLSMNKKHRMAWLEAQNEEGEIVPLPNSGEEPIMPPALTREQELSRTVIPGGGSYGRGNNVSGG